MTEVTSNMRGTVTSTIAGLILSGEWPVGHVLPSEADLSTKLGVGRNTLREAIKVLGSKGLLATRTKLGSRVRPRKDWSLLDPDVVRWRLDVDQDVAFIHSLCDIRLIFEPPAAARAARRATQTELARMREALDRMVNAPDQNSYTIADMEFHRSILAASGNELLLQLSTSLEAALIASRRVTLSVPNSAFDSMALHAAVFEAISARDSDKASANMTQLIEITIGHVDDATRHQAGRRHGSEAKAASMANRTEP